MAVLSKKNLPEDRRGHTHPLDSFRLFHLNQAFRICSTAAGFNTFVPYVTSEDLLTRIDDNRPLFVW